MWSDYTDIISARAANIFSIISTIFSTISTKASIIVKQCKYLFKIQIFFKCVFFKSFSNVLQIFFKCLANFSFFVNNRDKLIQSLAVFWLKNISIAINHYFSGASAATQKVSVISKSSRYIWSLHILTDPTRSLHIPSDLSRS